MCGGWETNRSRLGQFLYLMLRDPFGQRWDCQQRINPQRGGKQCSVDYSESRQQ